MKENYVKNDLHGVFCNVNVYRTKARTITY